MSSPVEPPIFMHHAEIFTLDFESKQWVLMTPSPVPISIIYDAINKSYRLIAVGQNCNDVIVKSCIRVDTEFVKGSSRFCHWFERSSGVAYGVGFELESTLDEFMSKACGARASLKLENPSSPPPATVINNNNKMKTTATKDPAAGDTKTATDSTHILYTHPHHHAPNTPAESTHNIMYAHAPVHPFATAMPQNTWFCTAVHPFAMNPQFNPLHSPMAIASQSYAAPRPGMQSPHAPQHVIGPGPARPSPIVMSPQPIRDQRQAAPSPNSGPQRAVEQRQAESSQLSVAPQPTINHQQAATSPPVVAPQSNNASPQQPTTPLPLPPPPPPPVVAPEPVAAPPSPPPTIMAVPEPNEKAIKDKIKAENKEMRASLAEYVKKWKDFEKQLEEIHREQKELEGAGDRLRAEVEVKRISVRVLEGTVKQLEGDVNSSQKLLDGIQDTQNELEKAIAEKLRLEELIKGYEDVDHRLKVEVVNREFKKELDELNGQLEQEIAMNRMYSSQFYYNHSTTVAVASAGSSSSARAMGEDADRPEDELSWPQVQYFLEKQKMTLKTLLAVAPNEAAKNRVLKRMEDSALKLIRSFLMSSQRKKVVTESMSELESQLKDVDQVKDADVDKMLKQMATNGNEAAEELESELTDDEIKKNDHYVEYLEELRVIFNSAPKTPRPTSKESSATIVLSSGSKSNSNSRIIIDPITKAPIPDPVTNLFCGHVYGKKSISTIIKKGGKAKCPYAGCANPRILRMDHLQPGVGGSGKAKGHQDSQVDLDEYDTE